MQAELLRRSTSAAVTHDRDAVRERCKTLSGFIREAWHVIFPATPYVENWHIEAKCAHFEAVSRGALLALGYENRIVTNEPPGTMKSLAMCVFWLAYEWGPLNMAELQAIAASYRIDFCLRDQARFSKLVNSGWYQSLWPHVEITGDSSTKLENSRGGKREAIPFPSLTGARSDRLYIDDPHSVDTAESDADRESAERRFRESATNRMNDPITSFIGVIMQRLHQMDITGVIAKSRMPYLHLLFPMRFDPQRCCYSPVPNDTKPQRMRHLWSRQMWLPDTWKPVAEGEQAWAEEFASARVETVYRWDKRTKAGELLFPDRFPRAVVERDEAAMGAHATASQYDQRPNPRGGLKFKRHNFPIVKAVPSGCRTVRGWDLAASENRNSAYTCGLKLSFHPPTRHFYVEHVVRVRTENVEPVILNTARQDNNNGHRVEISLPQDPGQAGKVQVKALVGALIGFIVHRSPESGDKLARAEPVIAQSEAGNISILEGDWNEAFLDEIELFPSGTFKDQVDALSRAFSRFVMTPMEYVMPPIVVTRQRETAWDNQGN
jgi:predicted phage terminase large subunit-like protein